MCGADWGSEGKPAFAPLNPEGRKQEALLWGLGKASSRTVYPVPSWPSHWSRIQCRKQSLCRMSHASPRSRDKKQSLRLLLSVYILPGSGSGPSWASHLWKGGTIVIPISQKVCKAQPQSLWIGEDRTRAAHVLGLSVLPGVGLAGGEPSHASSVCRNQSMNLQTPAVVLLDVQLWGPSITVNQVWLLTE